ncbi:MAG: anthranilate phosphoribosyltransferase, partial [Desulfovibrio sp.]|nr:anthranilate phosphoribosyltransferase [Desulfovibrio sp.]
FLLIDNYDSFTYNLVQAFYSLGMEPMVLYNDDPKILDLAKQHSLNLVCLSPGPGDPSRAGLCLQFLDCLDSAVPVLGVCLGHQILGAYAGNGIVQAKTIMHGKQSIITHTGTGMFENLPLELQVGRYHSLVVDATPNPKFSVIAQDMEGQIMALQYCDRPWCGLQFHPESVLTNEGMRLLSNFPKALLAKKSQEKSVPEILNSLAEKRNLDRDDADLAFGKLMDGQLTQSQAGSLLIGLRMKGESHVELASATRQALMRARTLPSIDVPHIDVVGTGGDGRHSFNCSTATSLVLAGLGYTVTKHGNRAVSSTCGSADALEGLGLTLSTDIEDIFEGLAKTHFAFFFAPNFHPSFKNIAPIRKELGIRTLFNILGPLINPSKPTHILLGAGAPSLVPLLTDTLLELGQPVGAVVCGAGVYDELTPIGPAEVNVLRNGKVESITIDPLDFGIEPCTPKELEVHSKKEAVEILRLLLQGQGPGCMLDMIVLNVGLAIYLLENQNLTICMSKAREAVQSGVGRYVLQRGRA